MTREGSPLFGHAVEGGVRRDEVRRWRERFPGSSTRESRTARDRAHYLRAVRPVQFTEGAAEPALLIDPLRVDALRARARGTRRGAFEIGADGAPTATIDPASGCRRS